MELEVVSTRSGRKATRAKAWRVCETGVTFFDPSMRASAVFTAMTPRLKPRLTPDEQAVLAAVKACGRASLMRIRNTMPARLPVPETARILTRLVTLGLVIEYEAVLYGTQNRSITYEAVHDPGA